MDRFECKVLLALEKLVSDGVITYKDNDSSRKNEKNKKEEA